MTVLAANFQRSRALDDLRLIPLPVKAATTIYTGSLVSIQTADGLALPSADAAGHKFMGVAHRGFDNAAGANGTVAGLSSARYCEVDTNGRYSFAVSGSAPKGGEIAYVADDNTVSLATGTNSVKCGHFVEPDPDGSGNWFVDIEKAF